MYFYQLFEILYNIYFGFVRWQIMTVWRQRYDEIPNLPIVHRDMIRKQRTNTKQVTGPEQLHFLTFRNDRMPKVG
jgi:hypothetical protein